MSDPFDILGRGAPLFRAVFSGLEFPIGSRGELVMKAGGPDRVVSIDEEGGTGQRVYALTDLLDAWPGLERFFPMTSSEQVAKAFAKMEVDRRKRRKSSPLLRIKGEGIKAVNRKTDVVIEPARAAHYAGRPADPGTSKVLMKALSSPQSVAHIQNAEMKRAFMEWARELAEAIANQHREAALAAAASAKAHAVAAENAANAALSSEKDVGASNTSAQAQQAVDQTCASATQAASEAQAAANDAATACAHAGSVPGNVEAQNACSEAQSAAIRAQSAANLASSACNRARDVASIGFAFIHGHVTEEDDCCDDDWSGATIEVVNVNYPEIPAQTTTTDGNGNYSVTGRFGHSSRVGCSVVRVTMYAGADGGDVSQSKQVTVCSSSPAAVNFTFDAPGSE